VDRGNGRHRGRGGWTMPTLTLTTRHLNSTKAVSVEPMAIPSTAAIIKPRGASLTKPRGASLTMGASISRLCKVSPSR
jgi:hypothetical protein